MNKTRLKRFAMVCGKAVVSLAGVAAGSIGMSWLLCHYPMAATVVSAVAVAACFVAAWSLSE